MTDSRGSNLGPEIFGVRWSGFTDLPEQDIYRRKANGLRMENQDASI